MPHIARIFEELKASDQCDEPDGWYLEFKGMTDKLTKQPNKQSQQSPPSFSMTKLYANQIKWQATYSEIVYFHPTQQLDSFQKLLLSHVLSQGVLISKRVLHLSYLRGTQKHKGHGISTVDQLWVRYTATKTRHGSWRIKIWGFASIVFRGVFVYIHGLVSQPKSASGEILLNEIEKYAKEERFQYLVCQSVFSAVNYYRKQGWSLNQPAGPAILFQEDTRHIYMHKKLE
jgi:hypothetical protein